MYGDTILAVHTDVSCRKKEAQWAELITQYNFFEGYEEAFKDKIFLTCDKAYLFTIKNELFGFSDKTVAQMLEHLEQQYLALTARDKKIKMKDVNIPWDRDDNIETYFVKADKLEEDLQKNYGIEWPTSMKITQAEDEIYRSNMFSKEEFMAWEEKSRADKTWVHLRTYFKNIWTTTMRYQGNTPQNHGFESSDSAEEDRGKQAGRLATNLREVEVAATANKEHIQHMTT